MTILFKDDKNADQMLVYHGMSALFLPMFLMPTFTAFAIRFLIIIRMFELIIVVTSRAPRAFTYGLGYLGINILYTVYHSFRYAGSGGYWDRIQSLFG